MRVRLAMTLVASVICVLAIGAEAPPATALKAGGGVTIYDPDARHLWNRLHCAISVRTANGVDYGADATVPFRDDELLTGEMHARVLAVLDEFVRTATPDRLPRGAARALLQHDLWAAFDRSLNESLTQLHAERKALRARLSKAIAMLALSEDDVSRLPDNYADAVKADAFPRDFDPAHPDKAFLPPGLFDSKGPWVEIGEGSGGVVAPMHVSSLDGRSIFRIFIRCPGERKDTLGYLEKLNLFTTPWALVPATIATTYPDGRKIRWEPRRLDDNTPQFPEGTMVALVRQMVVINDKLKLVASPITQSVQFRVFRKIGAGFRIKEEDKDEAQAFFEFNMRRGPLLAGKAGGLRAVAKDEVEYQLFPIGRFENATREDALRGTAGMAACITCHNANGIFSVNTYRRGTNPQLVPTPRLATMMEVSLARKKERYDWGVLRGMLEAER